MPDHTDHIIRPGVDKAEVRREDDTGLIEAVRRRAYELWQQEGYPIGREMDHWFQAEQEMLGRAPPLG